MVNLYKRGRCFWADSSSTGVRRRWSLKTKDREVAENLLRRIEREALRPDTKASLYERAAVAGAETLPITGNKRRLIELQRRYELDFDKLNAMIQRQNGVCILCFRPLGSDVCVDHEHREDGAPVEVRGILHRSCNVILGAVETKGRDFARNISAYLNWA